MKLLRCEHMNIRMLLFIVVAFISMEARGQDTTRVSLLFVGDVMGHDSQIAAAYDPVTKQYDYSACFQYIKPYVEGADVSFGNLEVTLAGPPYKGYPQFSSPDALAHTLKDIGFDVLVTANNHCVDRGKKGLERTLEMLDSLDIPHTGTFKDSVSRAKDYPLMIYRNGFSIALLNYTYGTNGLPVHKPNIVNLIDTALIRVDLLQAKLQKPDVIIVFMHWGNEYESLPSRHQKNLTEFCFKHGAQLVIGAHPHVIQPMEWRKERNQFVVYSLGNFVSGQRKRYTDGGAMTYLELQKVVFSPDSAVTTIDSAGYYLEWVYRTVDVQKKYHIIPVAKDDMHTKVIKDQTSKDAYKVFVNDSRKLLGQYNVNVNEIQQPPVKPDVMYRVLLLTTEPDEDPWALLTAQRNYIHGLDGDVQQDGKIVWLTGKFTSRERAEKYRQKYLPQHPEAQVVRYEKGRMVQ